MAQKKQKPRKILVEVTDIGGMAKDYLRIHVDIYIQ